MGYLYNVTNGPNVYIVNNGTSLNNSSYQTSWQYTRFNLSNSNNDFNNVINVQFTSNISGITYYLGFDTSTNSTPLIEPLIVMAQHIIYVSGRPHKCCQIV